MRRPSLLPRQGELPHGQRDGDLAPVKFGFLPEVAEVVVADGPDVTLLLESEDFSIHGEGWFDS